MVWSSSLNNANVENINNKVVYGNIKDVSTKITSPKKSSKIASPIKINMYGTSSTVEMIASSPTKFTPGKIEGIA